MITVSLITSIEVAGASSSSQPSAAGSAGTSTAMAVSGLSCEVAPSLAPSACERGQCSREAVASQSAGWNTAWGGWCTSLEQLPEEVLIDLLCLLSTSDLSNLLRVCKALKSGDLVERVLRLRATRGGHWVPDPFYIPSVGASTEALLWLERRRTLLGAALQIVNDQGRPPTGCLDKETLLHVDELPCGDLAARLFGFSGGSLIYFEPPMWDPDEPMPQN